MLGPVKNIDQGGPVGFVRQVRLARLRPGDDDAVKALVPKIFEVVVKVAQMPLRSVAPRKFGQRIKLDANRNVARNRIEELEELRLGVFEGRVRHVVDEREFEAFRSLPTTLDGFRLVRTLLRCPPRRNSASAYDQWHDMPSDFGEFIPALSRA